jgi:phage-related protein
MLKMVKYFVHTESVEDDLRALPWVPDTHSFPKNNYRSDYCGYAPPALYDEESQEKIRRQYCGDFAEFGYDPGVIPATFY